VEHGFLQGRRRGAILHRIGGDGEGAVRAGQAVIPALAALAVAALLRQGTSVPLIAFLGAMLVVALCIWLVLGVMSAAARAHRLRIFRRGSWLRLVAGGHLLRMAAALPVALWSALWIVVALVAQPGRTLAGAALVAALMPLIGWLVARTIDRNVIAEQRLRALLPPVIALAGAAALVLSLLVPSAPPESFGEGVAHAMRYTGTSALLGQVFDLHALSAGVVDLLRGAGWRAFALGLVLEGSVWFGLASAFALLLVPPRAALRILQADGRPGALAFGLSGVALAALVLVVLEGAAALEAQARDFSQARGEATMLPESASTESQSLFEMLASLAPSALRTKIERERVLVGGEEALFCPVGTIALLTDNQAAIRRLGPDYQARIETAARRGFERIRSNVPVFLDAYYSLSADYIRTLNLLTGSAEDHLQEMIIKHLGADDPLGLAARLIGAAENELGAAFVNKQELLARCDAAPPDGDVDLVITDSMELPVLTLPAFADQAHFTRVTGASAFGIGAGLGGAIIGAVGGKIVVGTAFKAAATTLAKIAGGRLAAALAGAGAGALGGGAAGSVVPGAGTAVGAVVGGATLFIGGWLASDYTLLKIDERLHRAEFEAEILAAIDQTEAEFLAALRVGH